MFSSTAGTQQLCQHFCNGRRAALLGSVCVCVTAPALDTKSPKNTLRFCNRVTMETHVQLHQGGVDVSRKRESRWVGGDLGMHNEECCSKKGEAGMNCYTWTCSDVCVCNPRHV